MLTISVLDKSNEWNATEGNEVEASAPPLPYVAFVTTIVFFYQVASLVHMDISSDMYGRELVNVLNMFANFEVSVSNTLCPMEGLTILYKYLINVALKLSSIFNVVLLYVLWKCISICFIRNKSEQENAETPQEKEENTDERQKLTNTLNNDDAGNTGVLYFSDMESENVNGVPQTPVNNITSDLGLKGLLKIGFLKLVKLNFTKISQMSFQMIHCVGIAGTLHLYVYGKNG